MSHLTSNPHKNVLRQYIFHLIPITTLFYLDKTTRCFTLESNFPRLFNAK
ncbi:hypothetical protein SRABI82_05449 [Priestia megaterium]|nr:hypothetical protein SRABI82_05449 [Priestia megaterium]